MEIIKNKKIVLTTVSSWVCRILIILCQIVGLKLLLQILGAEKYAIMTLIASFGSWLVLLDFGFGVSIQNYISEKRLDGGDYNNIVRSCIGILLLLLLIIDIVGILFSKYFSGFLFGGFIFISNEEKQTIFETMLLVFSSAAVGNFVNKILYAQGRGVWANVLPALGALIGLLLVYFLSKNTNLTIDHIILLYYAPSSIIYIIVLFSLIDYSSGKFEMEYKLIKRSFGFFYVSIMSAFTLQIDYFVMSKLDLHTEMVVYNITTKLFSFCYFIFSSLLMALWPTLTMLMQKKDWDQVWNYIKLYVFFSLFGVVVFTIIFINFRENIIFLFSKNEATLELPALFIVLVGVYNSILLVIAAFTTALQSASILRVFIIAAPIQAFFSALFQWVLGSKFGMYGVVMGLIVSYLIIPAWLIPYKFYRYTKGR
jgi:Membrane protein involved in the export of O-antigen and teichoic acid